MYKRPDRNGARIKRHQRLRQKLSGTAARPRFCVNRSLNNIYVQIIDDEAGHTLVAASSLQKDIAAKVEGMKKAEAAKLVGKIAAERALENGIKDVVFDRGGYIYTGRVAEVAAGAREAGLNF